MHRAVCCLIGEGGNVGRERESSDVEDVEAVDERGAYLPFEYDFSFAVTSFVVPWCA